MATNNPFYVDPGNDFSAGLSGLAGTLSNIRQDRVQAAEIKRRDDAEAAQKQRQQEAMQAAQQAYQTGDPDMMARVSLQYPEIAQNLHQVVGLNDERKVKEAAGFARDLLFASPDQREGIFQNRIQALQDQKRDPTHTIRALQAYQQDPNRAMQGIELDWAAGDPKGYSVIADKEKARAKAELERAKMDREEARFQQAEAGRNQRAYARAAATAGASRAQKQTAHMQDFAQYQELKQTDPEAAKAFGMAAGFVGKEGRELSPQVQKRLSTAIDDTVAAERNVGKFEQLASEFEKSDFTPGVAGTLGEKLKELTGEQDAISNLRREFNAVKASQVVSNLPPGAASDKDIELATSGFPTDRANKEQLASFLRGLAKLQKMNAEFNGFKADHISETGSERGMLQAWKQREPGTTTSSPASQGGAPSVTTQAQFDALPSGAIYLEDGKQYRKP